jgi:hypothetical protein
LLRSAGYFKAIRAAHGATHRPKFLRQAMENMPQFID